MTRGGKTCWKAVRVLGASASAPAERLAALYRFQTGAPSFGHRFLDGDRDIELGDPDQVDWSGFPVVAALEAVTWDELRRLRMLLVELPVELPDGAPAPSDLPGASTSLSGHGSVWGIELGRPAGHGGGQPRTPGDV